jgi:hypothetical protein
MLNPTIPSIATTMPPPVSRVRVLEVSEKARKTITPIDPIIGITMARMLPSPWGSACSGGACRLRTPPGSSGASGRPAAGFPVVIGASSAGVAWASSYYRCAWRPPGVTAAPGAEEVRG